MSSLQRKNTVSKSSGPSHMNSYALRGLPIKYKTPIYVPDSLYLPASWKPPEMIPASRFSYNYELEHAVLAQARTRAISIAAEASLKRQQIEELRRQQREREEAEAQAAREAAPPQPLLLLGNDILTPTPVGIPNSGKSGSESDHQQSSDSDSPHSTSGIELNMDSPTIKSLGQMSIREFEGHTDDPFEIASLQAINDMEVLQSVLQPIPPPQLTVSSGQPVSQAPTAPPTQTTPSPAMNPLSVGPTRAQSSPISSPRAAPRVSKDNTGNPVGVIPNATPPAPVAPVQNLGGPTLPFPMASSSSALIGGASPSEPGVGLLIDIGGESSAPSQTPSTVDQPQGSAHPVPKPRAQLSSSDISQSPLYPNGPSGAPPSRSPPVPPRTARQSSTPTQERVGGASTVGVAPTVPPKPATQAPIGFPVPSGQPPHVLSRPGLGIPVLPPIPTSTPSTTAHTTPPLNIPPPPYSSPQSQPRGVVLPPYSSPKSSPRVAPRTYKLPDPQSGLNSHQKSQMDYFSNMGFPKARVARAILRFEGENTTQEILDFLFLVGQLEEKRYPGDSAETALIACKDDVAKAEEYLKKVEQYKEFGFTEKKIHDAYKESSGDWDKALDRLTEDR